MDESLNTLQRNDNSNVLLVKTHMAGRRKPSGHYLILAFDLSLLSLR